MKAKRNGFLLSGLLALTLLGSSCYGPFQATRNLWKWNGDVTDSKWGNEVVFLGLVIIPVYSLFMVGDALIFNSIEFWGGKNPIQPSGMARTDSPEPGQTTAAR